jgi:hypothetical protein
MLSYTFFNDEEEFTSWFCFFLSFRETTIFCFSKREMMRKKRSSKSLKIFLFVASSMNREEHYLSHESTLAH